MRCVVEPLGEGSLSRSGNWWTTMMTATPGMKPLMIGADRNSAIQPSRSSPTAITGAPTRTARTATRVV